MALIRFDSLVFPTGNPDPAADLNSLAHNARLLDALSYRGRRAFTGALLRYAYEFDQNPSVVMRGAFQYRSGITNLNIIAEADFSGGGTHTMRVYLNTVLRYSATWVTSRTNYFFNVTGYGFSDLDIVEVEVHHEWTGVDGQPIVIDAYVDAMSGGFAAYPTPPSFGALSEANLAALFAAQQWVYDRINRTDQPCFMAPIFAAGLGYDTPIEMLLFDGSIEHTNGANRLLIGLRYHILYNVAERVAVRINGTQVATQDFTTGQAGDMEFNLDISSYSADTPLRLTIVQVVLTPPAGNTLLGSRFSITDIFTRRTTYPTPTLPATYSPRQSLTFTQLQTALNQIRTVTNDAATRIGSAIGAFNRQRVFRWQPGADDGQNETYAKVLIARGRRAGDALWVRGRGLTIGWGPLKIEAKPAELYEWTPQYEETLIEGGSIQTRLVYFDQFPALDAGVEFYVYGERILYLAEQVR